eukprot:1153760-Pelagomonas_calceolata.AAC.4
MIDTIKDTKTIRWKDGYTEGINGWPREARIAYMRQVKRHLGELPGNKASSSMYLHQSSGNGRTPGSLTDFFPFSVLMI